MNNDKNKVFVSDLTQAQIDNSLKWLEQARADNEQNEKPCDGFALNKPSKVKALLLAPLLALSGWIVLIYLVAKR